MSEADPKAPASSPPDAELKSNPQETGYTFTDDPWVRWRNTWRYVTGGLTDEGVKQYREGRDARMEASDCRRCEEQRDYLLQYSPIVRFMNQKIGALGGDLHSGNIICVRCTEARGGGLDPNYGIQLCANRAGVEPLEDTLTHGTPLQLLPEIRGAETRTEMVHAYDHLRFNCDMANNLRHAACAEIRASSLSGECRFWREFWHRSQWKVTYQHQECVRRRATLSVSHRPNCKDDVEAAKVVNEVWDSCFADTRPFDEIYK